MFQIILPVSLTAVFVHDVIPVGHRHSKIAVIAESVIPKGVIIIVHIIDRVVGVSNSDSGLAALAPHGETLIIISLLSVIAPSANIVTQFSQMFGRDALYASLINTVTMLLCIITMPLMITLFQM